MNKNKVPEYVFVEKIFESESEEIDTQPIMIKSGDFTGLVFKFTSIDLNEESKSINYDFKILTQDDPPDRHDKKLLKENIEPILIQMLERMFENNE